MRIKTFTNILLWLIICVGLAMGKTAPSPTKYRKPLVVLPAEFANRKVVVEGSKEFADLVIGNALLEKQLFDEKNKFTDFKSEADKALTQKEKDFEKLVEDKANAKHKGFLSSFFHWAWGIFGIGIVAIIVLSIFNPAILVSVVQIFIKIARAIAKLFGRSLEGFNYVLGHLSKAKTSPVVDSSVITTETPK